MRPLPKGAYCILDERAPVRLAAEMVRHGAAVVQLRFKQGGAGELLRVAKELRPLCKVLLINDRPDVAKLCGADGVHLGQDDLPVREARRILGPDALIGLSTHSDAEIDGAEGADYIGFGPIFATASKPGAILPPPHGLEGLRRAVRRARVPVVAIGGITVSTVAQVAAAGAHCAASIAELCEDPSRVRTFAEAFR